jgi:hypothetical protein
MTEAPVWVNSIVPKRGLRTGLRLGVVARLRYFSRLKTRQHCGSFSVMKRIAFSIAALLALSACDTGLSFYYKPGQSVSRLQTDHTNCEVQALRDAPVANEIRQSAPIYFPGRSYCDASGCWSGPGYWAGGHVYTVDTNRGLRQRVLAQCMAQKGYQPVDLPACSPAVRSAVAPKQTTVIPKLTESSCAIRLDGGGWQIVPKVAAQ